MTAKKTQPAPIVEPRLPKPVTSVWAMKTEIKLDEAAMLSMGIDPQRMDVETLKRRPIKYATYISRRNELQERFGKDDLLASPSGARLKKSVSPTGLAAYITARGWRGSGAFVNMMQRRTGSSAPLPTPLEAGRASNDGATSMGARAQEGGGHLKVATVEIDKQPVEKELGDKGKRYYLESIRFLQVALMEALGGYRPPEEIIYQGKLSSAALGEWLSRIAQKEFGISTAAGGSALQKKMAEAINAVGIAKSEHKQGYSAPLKTVNPEG